MASDSGTALTARKLAFFDALSQAPDLQHVDVRVAWRIVTRLNVNTEGAWPSFTTIAHEVGVHRTTVVRSINRLVNAGWFIKRARRNSRTNNDSNVYWPNYEVVAHVQPPPGSDDGGGSAHATRGDSAHAPGVVAQVQPEPSHRTHPAEPSQGAAPAFDLDGGKASTSPASVPADRSFARQGGRGSSSTRPTRPANPAREVAKRKQERERQAAADSPRAAPAEDAMQERVNEAISTAWQTLVKELGGGRLMEVVSMDMLERARVAEQAEAGAGRMQLMSEARQAAERASEAAE
jgi:predicted transcriptional regulator